MQIHSYGIIVALALVIGLLLVEKKSLDQGIGATQFWDLAGWVLLAGVAGARLYHVLTDYDLYVFQPWRALFIWQGGLSIIGAVGGGGLALWWQARRSNLSLAMLLDLTIFGLPVAQSIGRWGNWVNQELYGLPTQLPWGIYIDPQHRLAGFEQATHYHPLFAYEAILTGGVGVTLWLGYDWISQRWPQLQIGRGAIFTSYIAYYAMIRFGLDFLRPDKAMGWFGLGINQWVLALVTMGCGLYWVSLQPTWSKD